MRNLKFWGKFWLEGMGMILGAALVMMFLVGIQIDFGAGSYQNNISTLLALTPWYLLITGAFIILTISFSAFHPYLSMLVSMNVTRKSAVRGLLLSITALILGVLALCGLIWNAVENDVSASGRTLFLAAAGVLFILGAVAVFFAGVSFRWKKSGVIITIVIMTVAGGAAGATAAITGLDAEKIIHMAEIAEGFPGQEIPLLILGSGVLLYLLASIFAVLITRKMEVRM